MEQRLLPATNGQGLAERHTAGIVAWVAQAGNSARFAFEEFFYGQIRNPFTRKAYLRAVRVFARWCEERELELVQVMPADVGRHLDELPLAPPTRKLHLAALRQFFDQLVLRHALVFNPALSVRGKRYQVIEGKTPEISREHARRLLSSIDTSHIVGLRDRAVIAILIYTAARVGAVAKLRRADFYETGDQYCLRFHEKGGKVREIPVRHDLQRWIQEYLKASAQQANNAQPLAPIFCTTVRRTKRLTARSMTADDMGRMLKRRLRDAGLSLRLSPHSLRVATLTDLLSQGLSLDDVQNLAGHADPRTTRLYDRRQRRHQTFSRRRKPMARFPACGLHFHDVRPRGKLFAPIAHLANIATSIPHRRYGFPIVAKGAE
jgi:integrase/recombinase XerD